MSYVRYFGTQSATKGWSSRSASGKYGSTTYKGITVRQTPTDKYGWTKTDYAIARSSASKGKTYTPKGVSSSAPRPPSIVQAEQQYQAEQQRIKDIEIRKEREEHARLENKARIISIKEKEKEKIKELNLRYKKEQEKPYYLKQVTLPSYYQEKKKTFTSRQIVSLVKAGKTDELKEYGLERYVEVPPPKDTLLTGSKYVPTAKTEEATHVFTATPEFEFDKKKEVTHTGYLEPTKSFKGRGNEKILEEKKKDRVTKALGLIEESSAEKMQRASVYTNLSTKEGIKATGQTILYAGVTYGTGYAKGFLTPFTQPVQTLKGFYHMARHPRQATDEMTQQFMLNPIGTAGEFQGFGKGLQVQGKILKKVSPVKVTSIKVEDVRLWDVKTGYGSKVKTTSYKNIYFEPEFLGVKGKSQSHLIRKRGMEFGEFNPKSSALLRSKKAGRGFSSTGGTPKRGKTTRLKKQRIAKGKPTSKAMMKDIQRNKYYDPKTITPSSGEFKHYKITKTKDLTLFEEPRKEITYRETVSKPNEFGGFTIAPTKFINEHPISNVGWYIKGKRGSRGVKVGSEKLIGSPFPLTRQYYQKEYNPYRKTQDMLNIKSPIQKISKEISATRKKDLSFKEFVKGNYQKPSSKTRRQRVDIKIKAPQQTELVYKNKHYQITKKKVKEVLIDKFEKRKPLKEKPFYAPQVSRTQSHVFAGDVKLTGKTVGLDTLRYMDERQPIEKSYAKQQRKGFRKGRYEEVYGGITTRAQAVQKYGNMKGAGTLTYKKGIGFSPSFIHEPSLKLEYPLDRFGGSELFRKSYKDFGTKDYSISDNYHKDISSFKLGEDSLSEPKYSYKSELELDTKSNNIFKPVYGYDHSLNHSSSFDFSHSQIQDQQIKTEQIQDTEVISDTDFKPTSPIPFSSGGSRPRKQTKPFEILEEPKLKEPKLKEITFKPPRPIPTFKTNQPKFLIPKGSAKKEKKKKGFNVEVKKRGKYYQENTKPLSLRKAMALGKKEVDNTASASFRIRPNDKSTKFITKARTMMGKEIRPSKNKRTPNVFVEKRKYRIDSAGEKAEITRKGLFKVKGKRQLNKIKWGK